LFPSIQVWQGLVVDEGVEPGFWEQVVDSQGVPRPGLAWIALSQTAEGLINVYQPHILYFSERFSPELKAGRSVVACLATIITSPAQQDAILQFRSPGPIGLRLNGRTISVLPGEYEGTIHPRLRPTRRTEPLHLRAGDNYLAVKSRPAEGAGGRWNFGGSLTSPEGEVLVDLIYRLPSVP
jgi:hypothetical protein